MCQVVELRAQWAPRGHAEVLREGWTWDRSTTRQPGPFSRAAWHSVWPGAGPGAARPPGRLPLPASPPLRPKTKLGRGQIYHSPSPAAGFLLFNLIYLFFF